jgi:hypothetical protein
MIALQFDLMLARSTQAFFIHSRVLRRLPSGVTVLEQVQFAECLRQTESGWS